MKRPVKIPPKPDFSPCTCPHYYGCPGILYHVPFMDQLLRKKDDPSCPIHGLGTK